AAWALEDVFVTTDTIDGAATSLPAEELHFAFGTLTEATSTQKTSWSQVTNTKGNNLIPSLNFGALPAPVSPALTLELQSDSGASVLAPVSVALDAFHFGFRNPVTIGSATGGAGAGRASFDELEVTTALAGNSPQLLAALLSGTHYQKALLTQ